MLSLHVNPQPPLGFSCIWWPSYSTGGIRLPIAYAARARRYHTGQWWELLPRRLAFTERLLVLSVRAQ